MNRSLENLDRVCNWLVEDMGNIIADSEALLMAASDVADAGFAGVRAQFENRLASARAALSDALSNALGPALDRAGESAGRADDWVRGNPWAAVGAAMAAGVLAGMLASRCAQGDGDA